MKRSSTNALALACLLGTTALFPATAQAQMNYQGRLTDNAGNPLVDGQYTIEFRVFNQATGGTELWGPFTATGVDLLAGRFNTVIGATDTTARQLSTALAGTAFLQIKVGANTAITPRQQILSAPKALQADFATNAQTANVANNFAPNGDLYISGSGFFGADSGSLTPPAGFGPGIRVFYDGNVGHVFSYDYANSAAKTLRLQQPGGSVTIGSISNQLSPPYKLTVGGTIGTEGGNSITSSGGVSAVAGISSGSIISTTVGGRGFAQINNGRTFEIYSDNSGCWAGSSSAHNFILETNNSAKMVLGTDGRVSMGTGVNPATRGYLDINGVAGADLPLHKFLATDASGGVGTGAAGTDANTSVYAVGTMVASVFRAVSDERIKKLEGRSDSVKDLQALLGIEITDYHYIDSVTKGSGAQKKVIAQQVEKVYPQAVSKSTDVIPDIFRKGEAKDGWVIINTDLKQGDRVRIIGDDSEEIAEVLEAEAGHFRPAKLPKGDTFFVYGREVKDFRTVDYEAISMLNVSATQELHRKLEAKDAEIDALKERMASLERSVSVLVTAAAGQDAKGSESKTVSR